MGGYRAEERIGRLPPMLYWAPDNAEQSRRRHEQLLARTLSSAAYESVYLRRDGSSLTVLVREAPLLDGNGRQIGWMAISEATRVGNECASPCRSRWSPDL